MTLFEKKDRRKMNDVLKLEEFVISGRFLTMCMVRIIACCYLYLQYPSSLNFSSLLIETSYICAFAIGYISFSVLLSFAISKADNVYDNFHCRIKYKR